ncbi:hypothetical protein JK636_17535 [Clostridium sp. YIM B02515]|uniref:Phr family secreted Rap phosphatase inhibitor n=1 Tax=Clostridium rhizosphaerae TaxID=2803861 RepID=A0ABS1TE65_9CLOT|nr:hypothetical protein [Clostridium rhizosphaerae]MBL4937526.1 hypothetical protein [Clostridium rhizosphaerae]
MKKVLKGLSVLLITFLIVGAVVTKSDKGTDEPGPIGQNTTTITMNA